MVKNIFVHVFSLPHTHSHSITHTLTHTLTYSLLQSRPNGSKRSSRVNHLRWQWTHLPRRKTRRQIRRHAIFSRMSVLPTVQKLKSVLLIRLVRWPWRVLRSRLSWATPFHPPPPKKKILFNFFSYFAVVAALVFVVDCVIFLRMMFVSGRKQGVMPKGKAFRWYSGIANIAERVVKLDLKDHQDFNTPTFSLLVDPSPYQVHPQPFWPYLPLFPLSS